MEIDRAAPARRESCTTRRTGVQSWRDLLFVHYEVPLAALRPLVPPELQIDAFEGKAYLGVVPFTMHKVRFGPVPLPDFLETNVRTYVHAGGVPGVWFLSLDAQNRLAVLGGRMLFRLPYHRAEMSCAVRGASTEYRLTRVGHTGAPAELQARWTALEAAPHAAQPGTLEHFLTERYSLYGPRRGGGVYRVRVHHRPWPLLRARLDQLETTLGQAAGLALPAPIELLLASPAGVAVETFARELPRG